MPSNSRGFRSPLGDFQCVFERSKQKLSNFTIYAYTVNAKSNLGTPKHQLFGLFWTFSNLAHPKEWENTSGGVKSRKVAKMGHPNVTYSDRLHFMDLKWKCLP